MGQIAFKFVKWDVPELATLKDCKVYRLRECLNNGDKLTRDDKNWLTEQVRGCCRFQKGIALMGYYFDFSDVLKRYFVKQYGHIAEYYAIDKTALRSTLYGRIENIVEVK
ncbi:molybdenum ABC transporter ATP-binding protein [Bacteroides stercorirosoris]|uniref:molybdenum ABC transporter ATP-binding protein n=1 Tax=Bacteroides stercorirosoris TaxID=871324 RepID=UPI0023F269FD|nr:molybdenum ABC transporter ATP-binding protein [Bacteroides stercorirosoris]